MQPEDTVWYPRLCPSLPVRVWVITTLVLRLRHLQAMQLRVRGRIIRFHPSIGMISTDVIISTRVLRFYYIRHDFLVTVLLANH